MNKPYEDQPWHVAGWYDPNDVTRIGDITAGTWTCVGGHRSARDLFDLFLMAEEWAIEGNLPKALWYIRAAECLMIRDGHE